MYWNYDDHYDQLGRYWHSSIWILFSGIIKAQNKQQKICLVEASLHRSFCRLSTNREEDEVEELDPLWLLLYGSF